MFNAVMEKLQLSLGRASLLSVILSAVSAPTLWVGRQEGHPAKCNA